MSFRNKKNIDEYSRLLQEYENSRRRNVRPERIELRSRMVGRKLEYLLAFISTLVVFVGELLLLISLTSDTSNSVLIVAISLLSIGITTSVCFGWFQYKFISARKIYDGNRVGFWWSGLHTIFASFLVYPIFLNLYMYLKSGLSYLALRSDRIQIDAKDGDLIIDRVSSKGWLSSETLESISRIRNLEKKGYISHDEANIFAMNLVRKEIGDLNVPNVREFSPVEIKG